MLKAAAAKNEFWRESWRLPNMIARAQFTAVSIDKVAMRKYVCGKKVRSL